MLGRVRCFLGCNLQPTGIITQSPILLLFLFFTLFFYFWLGTLADWLQKIIITIIIISKQKLYVCCFHAEELTGPGELDKVWASLVLTRMSLAHTFSVNFVLVCAMRDDGSSTRWTLGGDGCAGLNKAVRAQEAEALNLFRVEGSQVSTAWPPAFLSIVMFLYVGYSLMIMDTAGEVIGGKIK